MVGGETSRGPGAASEQAPGAGAALSRRAEIGALDLSLPPDLGRSIRAAAARLGETPRRLALDILEKVLGDDLLAAVLDRG